MLAMGPARQMSKREMNLIKGAHAHLPKRCAGLVLFEQPDILEPFFR